MMAPPDQATSIKFVFGGAIERNVDTKMLLFDNPTHRCEMQATANDLNARGGNVRMRTLYIAEHCSAVCALITCGLDHESVHPLPLESCFAFLARGRK